VPGFTGQVNCRNDTLCPPPVCRRQRSKARAELRAKARAGFDAA